jgi:hypothetical protein
MSSNEGSTQFDKDDAKMVFIIIFFCIVFAVIILTDHCGGKCMDAGIFHRCFDTCILSFGGAP